MSSKQTPRSKIPKLCSTLSHPKYSPRRNSTLSSKRYPCSSRLPQYKKETPVNVLYPPNPVRLDSSTFVFPNPECVRETLGTARKSGCAGRQSPTYLDIYRKTQELQQPPSITITSADISRDMIKKSSPVAAFTRSVGDSPRLNPAESASPPSSKNLSAAELRALDYLDMEWDYVSMRVM